MSHSEMYDHFSNLMHGNNWNQFVSFWRRIHHSPSLSRNANVPSCFTFFFRKPATSFPPIRRRDRPVSMHTYRESTRAGSTSTQSTGSASFREISRSAARTIDTRWRRDGSRRSLGWVDRVYVREDPVPRRALVWTRSPRPGYARRKNLKETRGLLTGRIVDYYRLAVRNEIHFARRRRYFLDGRALDKVDAPANDPWPRIKEKEGNVRQEKFNTVEVKCIYHV